MGSEIHEIEFGSGESFKELAMNQFYTVIRHSNVEFRGGFYTHLVTKDGTEKELYTPDTRDSYCNGVYVLALLVLPKFDDEMKTKWDKYNETKDKLIKEFIEKSSVKEEVILGDVFYEDMKDKILLETFRLKNLKLHHMLLKEISKQFARKNYFGMGAGID